MHYADYLQNAIKNNNLPEILFVLDQYIYIPDIVDIILFCNDDIIYQVLLEKKDDIKFAIGENYVPFYERIMIISSAREYNTLSLVVTFIGEDVVSKLSCGKRCINIAKFNKKIDNLQYLEQLFNV